MKGWQIGMVLALLIASGVIGWTANSVGNDLHYISISSNTVGGEEVVNIPLNPAYGTHYQIELRSTDGRPFDVLFTNLTGLLDARLNGTFTYVEERSFHNVTGVSIEGQLPDGSDIYQLMIVSSEQDATVHLSASGYQGAYSLAFRPVLQAIYFITWLSNMFLFILFIYALAEYRKTNRL